MLDLDKIKARAKEGLHYSKWLYVWELIAEVERLQKVNAELQYYRDISLKFGADNDT